MSGQRFNRNELAFGPDGQAKIAASHVGIVGVGGIGSQVVQSLAYLGVGTMVLVDPDPVEDTNLNRLVCATEKGIGDLKVDVLKRAVSEISPECHVDTVGCSLMTEKAMRSLGDTDVIFGCVDNDAARLVLTELSVAHDIVLIDAATEIEPPDDAGRLIRYGGRVVVARPGDYCLMCAGQIDEAIASAELLDEAAARAADRHGYGLGEREPSPAVISLNGVVASLAVTEFLVMVTGLREPRRQLTYKAERGAVLDSSDTHDDDCYVCEYLAKNPSMCRPERYVRKQT